MARKMKDSGTTWLDKIPEDWGLSKINSIYELRMQKVSDRDYLPLSVTMNGVVPQLDTAAKTNAHDDRKLVRKGDFVINSRSDRRGSCGVSKYDGSVSLINTVMKPRNEMNPGYYNWLFHTTQFADEFYKWGHGIVDDLWTTNWQDMKHIDIPVPSLPEQKKIADYLNKIVPEIDSLSSDIQSQISILEDYKKSIITETVTKGLNPDVEMKRSEIAWVNTAPSHWTLSKIKYEIFPLQRPVYSDDLVMTCFRDGEVTLRQNRREDGFTVSFTENGYQGVEVGDLVIHGMDAFAGAIGCSDSRGKITPVVHVCKTTGNNRFFMYMLRSMAMNDVFMNYAEGIRVRSSDFRNFNKLGKFSIAVPPINEQNKIAAYLDKKCERITAIIAQKSEQLLVISDYKKSLIYEYVTGKREVPDNNG